MLRAIFIGSVEFSKDTLKVLNTIESIDIVGVVTKKVSKFNADFCNVADFAVADSEIFYYEESKNYTAWLKKLAPDIIFCFGWSHLLKEDVLTIPKLGVIGYHPTALPKNRGRHPLIWALALGLRETASTFFFMDKGADSGDILSQAKIDIAYEDDAATLYKKMTETALVQIQEFIPQLVKGDYPRVVQEHSHANYWRKRSAADGQIDFKMTSADIYNLVRSLTEPYVGAHLVYQEDLVKVWKVKEVEWNEPNIEPGKVLRVYGNRVLVKAAKGAVEVLEHEFVSLPKEGEYIL